MGAFPLAASCQAEVAQGREDLGEGVDPGSGDRGAVGSAVGPNLRNVRLLARAMLEEPSDRAPQVIIIEPEYAHAPVHLGSTPNDHHPPLPMAPGEAFLRSVYDALSGNPARWAKTLLIVTYDEHGGFYDHVQPHPVKYAPPRGATTSEREPTNDNQRASGDAARASLQTNRDRALERFPELALLRK